MTEPGGAVIEARDVRFAYGDVQALRGVTLAVPRGSFFALLGPNGAGKSTFVSLLSTLLPLQGVTCGWRDWTCTARRARCAGRWGWCFRNPAWTSG